MPLYDLKCQSGHRFERMISLADFEAPIICDCGSVAHRLISRPMISVEDIGYTCPITDKWVGSKAAHRENLAIHGCRVFETGEKEAAVRRKEAADAAFEAQVDASVEATIEAMPSAKRETLYNEMARAGADLAYSRSTAQ